jgi:hypothetical protein
VPPDDESQPIPLEDIPLAEPSEVAFDQPLIPEGSPVESPVQASYGPGPSSVPPEPSSPDVSRETLPSFDERHRLDFEGLLYLGSLTTTFSWLGHTFLIRTLTTDEVLEVGLIHRPFVNTMAEAKAYQAAVVAGCVQRVDNKPLVVPLTDSESELSAKFVYVKDHWFPPVLDAIYEQYLLLENKVEEVIAEMGKASGWTDATPGLSLASA